MAVPGRRGPVRTDRGQGQPNKCVRNGRLPPCHLAGKRPFLTRRSGFSVCRRPVPGQQIVKPAHWMSAGHAFQHVLEIGEGLDLVELGGSDEGAGGYPSGASAVGSGKQVVLATERYQPFILPMSGRK